MADQTSTTTTPNRTAHLPAEIRLLIAYHCPWNTLLCLRLTNKSWYNIVHTTLSLGNPASSRLAAGHWYTTTSKASFHIPGNDDYDAKLNGVLQQSLKLTVASAQKVRLRCIPGGGLQRHGDRSLEWKEWVDVEKCGVEEIVVPDVSNNNNNNQGGGGGGGGGSPWWQGYSDAIGSLGDIHCAWRPPVGKRTKIHRIIGMLWIVDSDESCRFEVREEAVVKRLAEEFPRIITRNTPDPRKEDDERETYEDEMVLDEEEDLEEEEQRQRSIIPFATDPLFDPSRAGPIPCRVRYRFKYPAEFYENAIHEDSANIPLERILGIIYDHEISDTKLYIFRRRHDDSLSGYITVGDFVSCLEEHLRVLLRWEERISINDLNIYPNPYGWLDLTFSVTPIWTPHDSEEYIPPKPFDSNLPFCEWPEDYSDAHSSDSSRCPSPRPHPVVVTSAVEQEDDDVVHDEESDGNNYNNNDDDETNTIILKSQETTKQEGWAEEVDEKFDTDLEFGWRPWGNRRVVINEKPYSEMGWYRRVVFNHGEVAGSLTAYEESKVGVMPGMNKFSWEI